MQTLSTPDSARAYVLAQRSSGQTVGIVPTMGALHEGHLSLVRLSQQSCDQTVASIFVNPSQFGPDEDFDRYPRTLEDDLSRLSEQGVDAVFTPAVDSMYPQGFSTYVEPPTVGQILEADFRPGHFRGVTTIVLKLFHALPATHAFFGQKDYQQWKVIEAMTRDLDVGIEIVAGETVRESDGLALSSRNRYLTSDQRLRALSISQSLDRVAELVNDGNRDVSGLEEEMTRHLSAEEKGVDAIDYAVIVDSDQLTPLSTLDRKAVALIAVHVGSTRLIDNRIIGPAG